MRKTALRSNSVNFKNINLFLSFRQVIISSAIFVSKYSIFPISKTIFYIIYPHKYLRFYILPLFWKSIFNNRYNTKKFLLNLFKYTPKAKASLVVQFIINCFFRIFYPSHSFFPYPGIKILFISLLAFPLVLAEILLLILGFLIPNFINYLLLFIFL